ncbi:MAG: molecular chaperone DnaJ [Flaviflexus sp.]|nr:molecular chaperone DnaJ [Flaviflexus sp.]
MANYYEILGVEVSASTEEIKRAYRKKARRLHPDVAGPDKAEEFKSVTAAYEVLSNPEKRRRYDMGGESALGGGADSFGEAFQDIFNTFFGGATAARGPVPRGRRGQDARAGIKIELEDAVFGTVKQLTVETAVLCTTCNGTCMREGAEPQTCQVCHGEGTVKRVTQSLFGRVQTTSSCGACHGHGTVIADPCPDCAGEGRVRAQQTIDIDIPAGVETGTRIQLVGQSEVGPAGGPPGDLFVDVYVKDHPVFTRRGDDLVFDIEIPMTAAALGTTMTVDTFDGPAEITIEPGTSSGHHITMPGRGVGKLHQSTRGNLIINVNVLTPTKLSGRQRELVAELAKLRGEESPQPTVVSQSSSMFSRFKDRFR